MTEGNGDRSSESGSSSLYILESKEYSAGLPNCIPLLLPQMTSFFPPLPLQKEGEVLILLECSIYHLPRFRGISGVATSYHICFNIVHIL